eukprot:s416_g37.t1
MSVGCHIEWILIVLKSKFIKLPRDLAWNPVGHGRPLQQDLPWPKTGWPAPALDSTRYVFSIFFQATGCFKVTFFFQMYKKTFIDCGDASAEETPRSKSLPPRKAAIVLTEGERWRHHYVQGLNLAQRIKPEHSFESMISFYFGNCTKGLDCQFCHLEHDEPKRKLDKVQRRNLDNLSEPQVISLLLHQLQTRSRQQGLTASWC